MFTAQDITTLKTTLKELFPYGIIDSVDDAPANSIYHKLNRKVIVKFTGVEENAESLTLHYTKRADSDSQWYAENVCGTVSTITEAIDAVMDIANTENISAIFYA